MFYLFNWHFMPKSIFWIKFFLMACKELQVFFWLFSVIFLDIFGALSNQNSIFCFKKTFAASNGWCHYIAWLIFNWYFSSQMTDYRLSITFNGEPKYWHERNYDDIDFLKEHTKEDGYVFCFYLCFISKRKSMDLTLQNLV